MSSGHQDGDGDDDSRREYRPRYNPYPEEPKKLFDTTPCPKKITHHPECTWHGNGHTGCSCGTIANYLDNHPEPTFQQRREDLRLHLSMFLGYCASDADFEQEVSKLVNSVQPYTPDTLNRRRKDS